MFQKTHEHSSGSWGWGFNMWLRRNIQISIFVGLARGNTYDLDSGVPSNTRNVNIEVFICRHTSSLVKKDSVSTSKRCILGTYARFFSKKHTFFFAFHVGRESRMPWPKRCGRRWRTSLRWPVKHEPAAFVDAGEEWRWHQIFHIFSACPVISWSKNIKNKNPCPLLLLIHWSANYFWIDRTQGLFCNQLIPKKSFSLLMIFINFHHSMVEGFEFWDELSLFFSLSLLWLTCFIEKNITRFHEEMARASLPKENLPLCIGIKRWGCHFFWPDDSSIMPSKLYPPGN